MQSLVLIRKSEVPVYLQDSELYLSLDDENDDEMSVPSNCFKRDTGISNLTELDQFLATVSFWITSPLCIELMNYVVDRRVPGVKDVVAKYRVNYPTLFLIVSELHRSKTKLVCDIATKHGSIELLKPVVVQTFKIAAEKGHMDCLRYCFDYLTCHKIKICWSNLDWSDVITSGHVECLTYLVQHGLRYSLTYSCLAAATGQLACLRYLLGVRPDRSSELVLAAVANDQLDCLKCIVEQEGGCEVTFQVWEAAMKRACDTNTDTESDSDDEASEDGLDSTTSSENFHCLTYLLDTVAPPDGFPLVDIACQSDNKDVLQLLHQRGYALTDETVLHAARCGSWECLQYLHTHCQLNCWAPSTMVAAAGAGQLALVKQLHAQGCPWDESAPIAALNENKADCLQYFLELRGVPNDPIFKSATVPFDCWMVIHKNEVDASDRSNTLLAYLSEAHLFQVQMLSEPVYKIVDSGERGKIAVATRDILPGELVLRENEPLLHIGNVGVLEIAEAALKTFAEDASPEQKEKILSLFGPTDTPVARIMRQSIVKMVNDHQLPAMDIDTYLKVLQVVNFNAFELGALGHGVYAEFTRLSHSCASNCAFSFKGEAVYCFARTFIKSGEELTITYTKSWDREPTHERRYKHLQTKEFTCHCPRCDAIGDDTRQFDCCDPACKGVMMVCQPINKRPILMSGLQYTGVKYVEPHLLPCTVCHRTAPVDYQQKMFALETKMYEQGPRLVQAFADLFCRSKNDMKLPEVMELLHTTVPPRHAAALPFLQTRMKVSAITLLTGADTSPHALPEARQALLEYVIALHQILPFASDSLSEGLTGVVALCCLSNTVSIMRPETERLLCGEALRMTLLLYGRDRRQNILDAAMLRYHEKNPSAHSTEVCAFCEESPLRAAFTLSRCGKCRQVCYCSVECQKAHWKLHKKFCKAPEGK